MRILVKRQSNLAYESYINHNTLVVYKPSHTSHTPRRQTTFHKKTRFDTEFGRGIEVFKSGFRLSQLSSFDVKRLLYKFQVV